MAASERADSSMPGAPVASRDAEAFHVEQHGLGPIPRADRHGHPRELFWVFLGGGYSYVVLAAGALPILFGLSLRKALLAVVVGNVLGTILFALCSRHGPRTGTATIVTTRAALGHRGNLLAAAISLLATSGWVAVSSVIATLALFQLLTVAGAPPSTATKAALLALLLAAQIVIAIYGHAMVMALSPIFATVSAVLLTGIMVFALPKLDWSAPAIRPLAASTETGTFLLALGAMAAGPLGWASFAADHARYLPEDTSANKVALYSGLGVGIANVAGCTIGTLLATLVDMHDPLTNIPRILPTWYLIVFLAAVIWSSTASNLLSLYSAGLGLLALRVVVPRWASVLGMGLAASVLTYIEVFVDNFMDIYAQFLSLSLCFICPWVAVLLVDYAIRRGQYDADELHTWGRGRYWFQRGVNVPGLASYLAGIAAAFSVSSSSLWHGPISIRYLGGSDLSTFAGLLVAGTLYFVFADRRLRPGARA